MADDEILEELRTALGSLDPEEVRVYDAGDQHLHVLVVSSRFQKPEFGSLLSRMTACIELIFDNAGEVADSYTFQVEPVTPREFKERLVPWPE